MSYCRWGENGSDVYMFPHTMGWVCCCGCKLHGDDSDTTFTDRRDAIEHLLAHRAKGDTVPEYAIERLRQELADEGET